MRKIYCEKCNKKVEYNVIQEILSIYKGVEINLLQNIGTCSICNEKLYVIEIEELNLINLYSLYKLKNK